MPAFVYDGPKPPLPDDEEREQILALPYLRKSRISVSCLIDTIFRSGSEFCRPDSQWPVWEAFHAMPTWLRLIQDEARARGCSLKLELPSAQEIKLLRLALTSPVCG